MANDSLTTPHNQAIVGDGLTSLIINYQWRKLIADMIYPATHREFWTGSDADIDVAIDNAISLIIDLYNTESVEMSVSRIRTLLTSNVSVLANTWTKLDFAYPTEDYLTYSIGNLFVDSVKRNVFIDVSEAGLYRILVKLRVYCPTANTHVTAKMSQASVGVIARSTDTVFNAHTIGLDSIVQVAVTDSFEVEVHGNAAFSLFNGSLAFPETMIEAYRLGDL